MEVKFKKKGLLSFGQTFSEPFSVINLSKGGIAFSCDRHLSKGKKLVVQLLVPGETPLDVHSIVRRQQETVGSRLRVTGVEFMPFGDRPGWNKEEILDVLRKLDKKYGRD